MQTTDTVQTSAQTTPTTEQRHAWANQGQESGLEVNTELWGGVGELYVHIPLAPIVPTEPQHALQRRYGPDAHSGTQSAIDSKYTQDHPVAAALSVYRNGGEDVAEVTTTISIKHRTTSATTIRLSATELRDAACRLLDAAYDLEANPARRLKALARLQGGAQ